MTTNFLVTWLLFELLSLGPPKVVDSALVGSAAPSRSFGDVGWPGWRGGPASGRASSPLPLTWTAREHVRWGVVVPGVGHSSPIVAGDRVYLTTAYPAPRLWTARAALQWLLVGLLAVLAAFATRLIGDRCHPARQPQLPDFAAAAALAATVLAIGAMTLAGEALFDFRRCDIRGWIGSATYASLCLCLGAYQVTSRSLQLALGLAAIGFAVFVVAGVPSKAHAFRGGWPALNTQVVLVTGAVPVLVGARMLWRACSARRLPTWVTTIVSIGVLGAAALLVVHMIVFRDDTVPEVESLRSRFGAWSLIFVAATIAPAWLWWRSDRRSLSLTLACLGTAGFGMLLSLAAVVDALARHSPYLTYQIGVLRPALQPGPWAAALVCGVAFGQGAAAGWTSRRTIRPMRKSAGASAIVLRIAAVALGGLFFVRTNYAPEVTQMVRAIVALDRETGGQMWLTEGLTGPPDTGDGRNSPATPTPVVAGDRVCGYFGNAGLMCVDLQGKPAWSNTEVGYSGYYGVGFSPMVSDGKLIVASNTPGGTAIVRALDVRDGRLMWNREWRAAPVLSGNNRTPLAMTIAGGPALVVWGSSYLRILSSRTGASLWTAEWDSSGDQVASVAADEHRLYLTDAMGTTALDPALLSGAQDPVRWRSPARANCSSPVACRGLLFTVTDGGVATAVRADTGKAVWRHRMPGQYFASLIASSDAVYFTNSDGLTTVVSCETAFRRLAVNDVGEPTTASMAAADGDLYLRTASHVYRIGRR